jgi:hypothetical protein
MNGETIYGIASASMKRCIETYLALAKSTSDFSVVGQKDFDDPISRVILLAGKVSTQISLPAMLLCWSGLDARQFRLMWKRG